MYEKRRHSHAPAPLPLLRHRSWATTSPSTPFLHSYLPPYPSSDTVLGLLHPHQHHSCTPTPPAMPFSCPYTPFTTNSALLGPPQCRSCAPTPPQHCSCGPATPPMPPSCYYMLLEAVPTLLIGAIWHHMGGRWHMWEPYAHS
jgi:hypothetical protein